MTRYVALLRAVNVGGTGKLPMSDLRALCEARVKATLERALFDYAGKAVGVVVRTRAELAAVLAANPYQDHTPNRVVAIFLDEPPAPDWRDGVSGLRTEEMAAGVREIFVHYREGQADTKLKIPAASKGTARNMNTVARLAELASVNAAWR